jgi:multiple sugar transport system permease protein
MNAKPSNITRHQSTATTARVRWRLPRHVAGYLFIAPAIIYLLLAIGFPLFTTIRTSFIEFDAREKTETFIGLQNYAELMEDERFWGSMKNTIVFTLSSTFFHVLVGSVLALLLNEKWASSPVRNFTRGLLILPWLFSLAASALMWGLLYQPLGPLNFLLIESGLVSDPVDFLGDRSLAIWSLIFVNVWKFFPFYMVMILGGLQSIPLDLYDAAHVDGAGRFQRLRFITLPLLSPVIVAVTAIDLITTFTVFDIVKIMTNGGPLRTTETAAYYIWQIGYRDVNFGYGSAASVVMLVIIGAATFVYLRLVPRSQFGDDRTTDL